MDTQTISRTTSVTSTLVPLKGRSNAIKQRNVAFGKIAELSLAENMSRAASVENMQLALGDTPTVTDLQAAKVQWLSGRIAARLPVTEFPSGMEVSAAGTMAFAFDLLTRYAMAPKKKADGTFPKQRPLRHGQLGYRSQVQQRIVGNAEEAWSVFIAECGHGAAQTNSQRGKNKRKPRPGSNAADVDKSVTTTPNDGENMPKGGSGTTTQPQASAGAASGVKHMTPDIFAQHMVDQLSSLLAFDNKYAKVRPVEFFDFAQKLAELKTAVNGAMNKYGERKARVAALKAENSK